MLNNMGVNPKRRSQTRLKNGTHSQERLKS